MLLELGHSHPHQAPHRDAQGRPACPGRAKVAYVKVVAPLVGQELKLKDKNGNPVPQLTHQQMVKYLKKSRVAVPPTTPVAQ
ncbi:unnamed protein product [Vitrella brassicaformis CCMP3155]|uniref:Uncharacterized protein n=1 Tax=Vitrella brassicaformis (strain CCMP3155) TaxID=1169540 RepID=A0A0G4G0Y1_VITBC|nr:unnamed protein product [Vitrella brassicaformis CCMP3155]|eukprot:CEM21735.1 unnamed protein product [Vitrella brassicaformis CCMP3155]